MCYATAFRTLPSFPKVKNQAQSCRMFPFLHLKYFGDSLILITENLGLYVILLEAKNSNQA